MGSVSRTMKWVMLVCGTLTCSMIYAAFDPKGAMMSTFGATTSGPIAEVIVRSWGCSITLIGGMLIYGALHPIHRTLILIVATISKMFFVALVLTYASDYLDKAITVVILDSAMVIAFLMYLLFGRTIERD